MSSSDRMVVHCYPWYIADWSQSESVAAMTMEERGLYRELLDLCYANGSIPDDPTAIQKLTRSTEKEIRRAWPKVRNSFYVDATGRMRNHRCDRALIEIAKSRTKRSEAGSRGAEKRWQSDKSESGNANSNAIGDEMAMRRHTPPPSHPPSHPHPPPPSQPSVNGSTDPAGWPLTRAWLTEVGARPKLVDELISSAVAELPSITDEALLNALQLARKPNQRSPGLFRQTLPEVIREEVRRFKAAGGEL